MLHIVLVRNRTPTCCGASASAFRSRFSLPGGPAAACADALDAPAASPCTVNSFLCLVTQQFADSGAGFWACLNSS